MSRSFSPIKTILALPCVLLALSIFTISPVISAEKMTPDHSNMEKKTHTQSGTPWAYHGSGGPEQWGHLSSAYAACGVGQSQSPIDIREVDTARMQAISFHYRVTPANLVHNGHTVQVNYTPGSSIAIGDDHFDLMHFHFHTPSEHKINGQAYPMEIQFVHKHRVSGRLAVVGVLVAPGDHNLAAQEIWDHLPATANTTMDKPRVLFNGRDLLPENQDYYRYMGSLTTPPCTEGVSWYVLQHPVQFSAAQIDQIGKLMGYNSRPIQARNHRMLLKAGGL